MNLYATDEMQLASVIKAHPPPDIMPYLSRERYLLSVHGIWREYQFILKHQAENMLSHIVLYFSHTSVRNGKVLECPTPALAVNINMH